MNVQVLLQKIQEIKDVIQPVLGKIANKEKNLPGTMNIIELMARHHLENEHSRILAFLLNPNEKHHHSEYGVMFLRMLKKSGLIIDGEKITGIVTEKFTDTDRRIDIWVETDKKEVIIIENKINAYDQNAQLKDYYEYAKKINNKNFLVYLTKYGDLPSESSLPTDMKLDLKNRYIEISYRDFILSWLAELQTKINGEDVLHSALNQYIDIIKLITDQREEQKMERQEIVRELFNKEKTMNRENLSEKITAARTYLDTIAFTAYVNFLCDIHKTIKEDERMIKNNINVSFWYNTEPISDRDKWENAISSDFQTFGIAINVSGNMYYVIEFASFEPHTQLTYGIYANNIDEKNLEKWQEIFKKDGGKQIYDKKWQFAIKEGNWFFDALLCNGNEQCWEQKIGKQLSVHIAEGVIDQIAKYVGQHCF